MVLFADICKSVTADDWGKYMMFQMYVRSVLNRSQTQVTSFSENSRDKILPICHHHTPFA